MASDSAVKLPRAGLSLYADLLDPTSANSAPGTISRAAVVFKQSEGGRPQQDEPSAQRQQISAGT